jgi:hypothetical protein
MYTLSSSVYEDINLIVCVPIRCPSVFMNVAMWDGSFIFGCGKVFDPNPIICTNFVSTVILSHWFENTFCCFFIEIS